MVLEMEDKLTGDEEYQMAAMAHGTLSLQEQEAVHSVLQTYTVPLARFERIFHCGFHLSRMR